MDKSEIREFYKDKNVLVTGGTGFMGKVLIEKLLRDTDVSTIYVLIRGKRGKNAHSRIDDLFDDVLFDGLKERQPKCKNRVEAIPGDCTLAGLGLSITDRQRLISDVHVVFHVAATVNFDEPIKAAYDINVNGPKDLIGLAREMRNLKSVLHISTAYSHCTQQTIEEKCYDVPVDYEDLERALQKLTPEEAEVCTPRILGKWPNTYTFTKALAESVVRNVGNGLPIGIFRPGIVVSTYKEPVPGWIDNMYGPTGVAAGTISGALRVVRCDPDKTAELVPVDTCVAAMVACAWDVAREDNPRTAESVPVYNYVSSPENPIFWREFMDLNFIHGLQYPLSNAIWCSITFLVVRREFYWLAKVLLHVLPAFFIDMMLVATGNKPRLLSLYKKVHKFSGAVAYFSLREWKFSNNNVQALWAKMNKTDQLLFPFSMANVPWLLYFRGYIKGVRLYLLKDPDSTLERSKIRNRRFVALNTVFKVIAVFIVSHLASYVILKLYHIVLGRH
ncbi:fatty acyl-CoA reductase wat-like [Cylas formicarius]|uniref:fatty acyl-CoA reductase wat-like n=1 Tax=Cylas formicarius TaxID=197179 RepID=UPI0029589B2D|nr:fatty acyl-CoA reductase wat-like [Cylas formicarius]